MTRILVVFGTRPEAIKMAPIVLGLREHLARDATLECRVCVTGQHRDMVDQVLTLFDIKPYYDLAIMRGHQGLADSTSRILNGVTGVLCDFAPDIVLVHGDTTTALAASLAAYFQRINVGHVEAGLRTGDIYAPWPEEVNRRVADMIAATHYAPTEGAKRNLVLEGVPESAVLVTGNTVIDALHRVLQRLRADTGLSSLLAEKFGYLNPAKRLILVTVHRRESFGENMNSILNELARLSERADIDMVLPVHPNPVVQEEVVRHLGGKSSIYLVAPLNYVDFVYLMNRAYFLLTDSGGIQEEAPSLGKPVLVMRNVTERPEAIDAGTARLVGCGERIGSESTKLLENRAEYLQMSRAHNPFGDGRAAEKIVQSLLKLGRGSRTKALGAG